MEFLLENKINFGGLKTSWIYSILFIIGLASCEEVVTPPDLNHPPSLVVEAYIESSASGSTPVYAILTESYSFSDTIGLNTIESKFVKGATVFVAYGSDSIQLQQLCLSDLPEPVRVEVLKSLGYSIDSVTIDFCIYADLQNLIDPERQKEYRFHAYAGSRYAHASVIIPDYVPLDSIWFEKAPGNPPDSFVQMFCYIKDPPINNFYRYFTQVSNSRFVAGVSSVVDDAFFNGQEFKFTLNRALGANEEFDETTGLWKLGDTVAVKWCLIDQSQYDFWNTLEVSKQRQGPFSSYIRINGNVDGALGVWAGSSCEIYKVIVKK